MFEFVDVPAPPVPSLLRGFSAPVKLRMPYTDDELTFLMANDSDAFNRWEAGQTLGTRLLLDLVTDRAEGRPLELSSGFLNALDKILNDPALDHAFAAQALTLPSEGYLGQQMPVIDVDGIHEVRNFAKKAIAGHLRDDLPIPTAISAATSRSRSTPRRSAGAA